jgi:hypothetical protein
VHDPPNEVEAAVLEVQLRAYRIAASLHGRATLKGDAPAANLAYDELQSIFQDIDREGNVRELVPLLIDTDVSVRLWAAAHLLSVGHVDGLATLGRIQSEEAAVLAMTAKYVIKQWRSGDLRFN